MKKGMNANNSICMYMGNVVEFVEWMMNGILKMYF